MGYHFSLLGHLVRLSQTTIFAAIYMMRFERRMDEKEVVTGDYIGV